MLYAEMTATTRCAMAMLCLAGALLAGVDAARADGVFLPEVVYPQVPKIPIQRGLIVHRAGLQTLILESTFDSRSPGVGWIVPLPGDPSRLELADGGMLVSLDSSSAAVVTNDLHWLRGPLLVIFLAVLPLMGLWILEKDREKRRRNTTVVLVIYAVGLLLLSLKMPGLRLASLLRESDAPVLAEVAVSSQQRVGDYQVTVLRAPDSAALGKWLADNNLAGLSDKARAIADDYITRNWCFVVARINREQGGLATPQPLRMDFATTQPVYPMRLTSLTGGASQVQLYVLADQQAEADGFRCAAADRFQRQTPDDSPQTQPAPCFAGERTGMVVAQPSVVELMWDGCVLTRLGASIPSEQMNRDVYPRWTDLRARRDHVFSQQGRRQIAECIALGGGTIVLLACGIVFRGQRRPSRWEGWTATGLLVIVTAAVGVAYSALPIIPFREGRSPLQAKINLACQRQGAVHLVASGELREGMTPEEQARLPEMIAAQAEQLSCPGVNPFTGEPLRLERSPGHIFLRTIDGKEYLCFYDENASELPVPLTPEP